MPYVDLDSVQRPAAGQFAKQGWGDQVNDNVRYLYGESAWSGLSYGTGWSAFSTVDFIPGIRRVGTKYLLRGVITGAPGTPIGNLTYPAIHLPFWPSTPAHYPVSSAGAYGDVYFDGTGSLFVMTGSLSWVALDGISFDLVG